MLTFVVLSPHRDDAAFSLGLLIHDALRAGHPVSVLNCFTQSVYAPFSDVENLHPNDQRSFVSALRRREDQAWARLVGAGLSFHDLDLLDAPLRLNCPPEEVLTAEIRPGDRALARVAGAVRKVAERLGTANICFFAPLALGGHIDHRIVRAAALEALAGPAQPALVFYEDLPYAAWDSETEAIPARAAALGRDLAPGFFAAAPAPDLGAVMHRKARMAECYDSQIDSGTVESISSFCRRYSGQERLWIPAGQSIAGLAEASSTGEPQ